MLPRGPGIPRNFEEAEDHRSREFPSTSAAGTVSVRSLFTNPEVWVSASERQALAATRLPLGGIFIVVIVAWVYLASMACGMNNMDMSRGLRPLCSFNDRFRSRRTTAGGRERGNVVADGAGTPGPQ